MEKLVFGDGEKIGVFDGETVTYYESEYIRRYREYAETRVKNDEWKYGGEGARFRGDYDVYRTRGEKIDAFINGVQWDGDKVLYCFTVNNSSGVYRKDLTSEKTPEEHVVSLSGEYILSVHSCGRLVAVTVGGDGPSSDIGVLDSGTAEIKTLTGGDSRDANACFSAADPDKLLFDSAGVGRNASGEFTGKYSPAAICSFHLSTFEIEELLTDEKNSFVKPRQTQDGTLYYIQRPAKEKRGGNFFLDVLLFPYRILQAIVMFVQAFVTMFTGKSLTSAGANPAKGRETDSRKLFVDGNLIEAEKEMKRNRKFKDKEYGFIPLSWKLVKAGGGKTEVVKSGVCDYALCADGGLYCTNGRHIFYIRNGECKKVADTEKCLCLATENRIGAKDDFFAV